MNGNTTVARESLLVAIVTYRYACVTIDTWNDYAKAALNKELCLSEFIAHSYYLFSLIDAHADEMERLITYIPIDAKEVTVQRVADLRKQLKNGREEVEKLKG